MYTLLKFNDNFILRLKIFLKFHGFNSYLKSCYKETRRGNNCVRNQLSTTSDILSFFTLVTIVFTVVNRLVRLIK